MFQREPFDRRSAWVWLIEHAAFSDTQDLRRGQLRTTLRTLAKEWKWSLGAIQRFLETGTRNGMFECISDTRYTTITICNYRQYQDGDRIGDTLPDTPSPVTRYITDSQPDTQYKESKKEERRNGMDSETHKPESESDSTAQAPSKYAYFGKVIRLTPGDYQAWRKRYYGIRDLGASLGALDDFYASLPPEEQTEIRRSWFIRASKALEKEHQAELTKSSERSARTEARERNQKTFGAPGFG